jgi:hypothetical protein
MTRPLRRLTIYYGLLQIAHLLVLGFGLLYYIRTGTISFPAPPPTGGWDEQAIYFLLGNGILDAIIGVGALIYVIRFIRGKPGSELIGVVCVTASLCSGGFFVVGTVLSGAWTINPVNYFGLVIVFVPVIALFLILAWNATRRKFQQTDLS